MELYNYKIESRIAYPISKTDDPSAGGPPATVHAAYAMCGPDIKLPLHASTDREACERVVSIHHMNVQRTGR